MMTESNWRSLSSSELASAFDSNAHSPDALSDAHRGYMLAYIEFEQAREAAVIDHFLEARVEKQ